MPNSLSTSPFVSVVLSVFNGEKYLEIAVRSILEQTFTNFELIAIDDGSTDASGRILETLSRSDSRLRVFSQGNQGLIAALNRGVSLSQGQFIARMDADDIAVPERLERQVEFLNRNPGIALVGSAMTLIDSHGKKIRELPYPTGPIRVACLMRDSCSVAHPTVMVRKTVLLELGGYRPAFQHAEDYDLWLRLIERHCIDNLPESLLLYRHHGGNVSVRFRQKQALATFFARYCATLRSSGRGDPLEGATDPIDLSILENLRLPAREEMDLRISLLKEAVCRDCQEGAVQWLEENLDWVWNNRSLVKKGKLVRRVLIPAAVYYWKMAEKPRAQLWFCRGIGSAPLSAMLALFRYGLVGGKTHTA